MFTIILTIIIQKDTDKNLFFFDDLIADIFIADIFIADY